MKEDVRGKEITQHLPRIPYFIPLTVNTAPVREPRKLLVLIVENFDWSLMDSSSAEN